jgi:hypothetical protein
MSSLVTRWDEIRRCAFPRINGTGHQINIPNPVGDIHETLYGIQLSDREMKQATLLAAIRAHGNDLKPLVIVPRDTCEAGLFSSGFTLDKVLSA